MKFLLHYFERFLNVEMRYAMRNEWISGVLSALSKLYNNS